MKPTSKRQKRQRPRRAKRPSAALLIGRVIAGLWPGEYRLIVHCPRCDQWRIHEWDAGRVAKWVDCLCGCLPSGRPGDGHVVVARPGGRATT